MPKQRSLQEMGSRLLLENVEDCNFVSNAGSKYEAMESPYIHEVAGRQPSLASRGNSSSDIRAEIILLASKLKAAKLVIEEL